MNRLLPPNPARSQDFGAASKLCVKSSRVAIGECKWPCLVCRGGLYARQYQSTSVKQIDMLWPVSQKYLAKRRGCARLIIAKVVSNWLGNTLVRRRDLPHGGQMVNAREKDSVRRPKPANSVSCALPTVPEVLDRDALQSLKTWVLFWCWQFSAWRDFGRRSQRLRRPRRCSWFGWSQISSDLVDREGKTKISVQANLLSRGGQREAVADSIARFVKNHTQFEGNSGAGRQ